MSDRDPGDNHITVVDQDGVSKRWGWSCCCSAKSGDKYPDRTRALNGADVHRAIATRFKNA